MKKDLDNKAIVHTVREHIHDMNNYLTIIKGNAEKLSLRLNLKDDPDLKKILDKSDLLSDSIARLREYILEISA